MDDITRAVGEAYYFSHDTIKKIEKKEIRFIDKNGKELKPSYFGAGMGGMNGTLHPARSSK